MMHGQKNIKILRNGSWKNMKDLKG